MLLSFPLLSLLFFVSTTQAANASDWQKRSIYQLLTDRFAHEGGDTTPCDTGAKKYCGGTWKATIDHLDYIQGMGFDAIWISPIVANIEDDTDYGQAYHGYWTKDFNSLNAHYGTEQDLKDLISELHKRDMYIMVDVVVNHVGAPSGSPDFASYKPFQSQSQYHPQCWVEDYTNQTEVEQCWLGDNKVALVDINTEDDQVVKTLNDWIAALVKNYNIDGIRIDTVKHVRKDFWPKFAQSAGVYTIGEVLSDDVNYTSAYTQVLDAVLDYPTWFQLTSGFSKPDGDLRGIAGTVTAAQGSYKNGEASTGSFLENHDQPRFASLTSDQALIKNANAWPFINDGIPILYYGQEQGYKGGNDPDNRESLWNVGYTTDGPLVSFITKLNKARKAAIQFNNDFVKTPVRFTEQTNPSSSIAIYKPPLLTLLTNVGAKGKTTWKMTSATGLGSSTNWVDVLTCTSVTTGTDGSLNVGSNGGEPVVLMNSNAVSKDPTLCPHIEARVDAAGGGMGLGVSSMTLGLAVLFGIVLLL